MIAIKQNQTTRSRAFVSLFVVATLCAFGAGIISGCAKTARNPLAANVANKIPDNIEDPLGIGLKPTAPARQATPALIHSAKQPAAPLVGNPRDFIAIFNQGGGVISVWGSTPASWIWAHSAALSSNFGDGFNWLMQPISDGFVRFVNKLTRTCLNVYGQGVIHYPCESNNPNQFFRLLPMQNGAVALQSASTHLCLQTGLHTKTNRPITLAKCLQVPNSEQQWFITPPFIKPTPIYRP